MMKQRAKEARETIESISPIPLDSSMQIKTLDQLGSILSIYTAIQYPRIVSVILLAHKYNKKKK